MKKIVVVFIILLSGFTTKAQSKANFNFSFNHLALSVKNLDSSVLFYTTVLGLTEITNRAKSEGIRWLAMGSGRELHLISTIKEPFITNKAIHLGIGTNNFDAFVQHLIKLKIPYSDWPGKTNTTTTRADGIKQVYFQDPNGYWIEVNTMQ